MGKMEKLTTIQINRNTLYEIRELVNRLADGYTIRLHVKSPGIGIVKLDYKLEDEEEIETATKILKLLFALENTKEIEILDDGRQFDFYGSEITD